MNGTESDNARQEIMNSMPEITNGIVICSNDFETYRATLVVDGKILGSRNFNRKDIERFISDTQDAATRLADWLF